MAEAHARVFVPGTHRAVVLPGRHTPQAWHVKRLGAWHWRHATLVYGTKNCAMEDVNAQVKVTVCRRAFFELRKRTRRVPHGYLLPPQALTTAHAPRTKAHGHSALTLQIVRGEVRWSASRWSIYSKAKNASPLRHAG